MTRNMVFAVIATLMLAGILGVTASGESRATAVATAFAADSASIRFVAIYARGLDRVDRALVQLDDALAAGDTLASRRAFRSARAAYKRIEVFTEYFAPDAARQLNGVPLPRAEQEDPETPLPPIGLQVAEGALFPQVDDQRVAEIRGQIPYMRAAVAQMKRIGTDTMPGDGFAFDAIRNEIARVTTLGIAGFDASASGDAIPEAAHALRGAHDALAPWRAALKLRAPATFRALEMRFAAAIANLDEHPGFDDFSRLEFITGYSTPLALAVADAQRALGVGPAPRPRAWSNRSAGIFDRDAVDPMFFAATDAPVPSPALIALGRELFFEPALSAGGQRSCATCHVPEFAFTDGRRQARLLAGHGGGARNTPTLLNAALQPSIFADDRVRTLEDQATDVLGNAGEMGGSLQLAFETLVQRGDARRFAVAFGTTADSALTPQSVRLALAAYVRSLVAMRSRTDRALAGDASALSDQERQGFELFMGKGRCGTCHFAPLFNGATPPMLVESEMEVIGVPARAARGAKIDSDPGRYRVRRIEQHLHAFRTPTLRNVALTGPYMHNGVFRRLEEVIDFYDGGGAHGIGIELPNQTLPVDSLRLSRLEKRALVAFLGTLTDTVGTTARP